MILHIAFCLSNCSACRCAGRYQLREEECVCVCVVCNSASVLTAFRIVDFGGREMTNVPDAAVGFLLNNLTEFVRYNADLIGGVGENVHKLCKELGTLKAFLKQCSERYDDNDFLESLADEIRDVVYQAEDVIETYIVYVSRQKLRGVIDRAAHAVDHALELRRVGRQLETVSKRVQEFIKDKLKLGFEAMKADKKRREAAKERKILEDDKVVGFEDEAQKVIQLLTEGPEQLEAVSIIGMLGLGKTTLARKVYNDPKIEYKFFIRAFVNVAQEYKKNEVYLNILRAFTRVTEEMKRMSGNELGEWIRKHLENRLYLIVLDDVWSPEAWEDLKGAFPNNNKRSRVLITSRNNPVALYAKKNIEPHHLRFMTNDESRELFRTRVSKKNECVPGMEEYEIRILEKCNGLPLAIVVVAGILVNHQNETHWWKRVADGMDGQDSKVLEQTNGLINLSFKNLPYSLKPCFLYLGVFREDSEIPVNTLLRLWTAEGFIPGDSDRTMEDIAEEYLEELVDRNLVMVGQRSSNGQIKTCQIHDTLRDFCKSEGKDQKLFREIKLYAQTAIPAGRLLADEDRRLCIKSFVEDYIKLKPSAKNVRSFLSFAKEETTLPLEYISSIPKAFKLLRVLDIRSIKLTRFPAELFYVVLLKYIAMSCDFRTIPEKVSNLWNLQTLIVRTAARTLEIKADILKMAQLRHLDTNASTCLQMSREMSSFNANLQTLSTISPESCRREVFERTPRLKKLGISGKLAPLIEASGESGLFDSLIHLEFLENLKLLNESAVSRFHTLPRETKFPKNLTKLTLLNTSLDWRHMSTLGKLNLEVLKLKDNAFVGELWQTEDGGFRRLKVLHIGQTNLVVWKASANSFPILTSLFVKHCSRLEAIPPAFVDIPTLQSIDLYSTNPGLALSSRKLQVAKLQMQAKEPDKKNSGFKLSVYPPDQ